MKIEQLMTRLDASWPFGGPEAMAIAAHDYRAVLGKFEGNQLFGAWDTTISDWRKAFRPLPADIVANVKFKTRATDDRKAVDWPAVKAFQAVLIDDWWKNSTLEAEQFLEEFAHDDRAQRLLAEVGPPRPLVNIDRWMANGCTDRDFARGKLADLIRAKAWSEAIRHVASEPTRSIDPSADDYERIRGQVRSQTGAYPKRVRDLGPRYGDLRGREVTPRYVRQSWNDVQTSLSAGAKPSGHDARLPERTESNVSRETSASGMPEDQRPTEPGPGDDPRPAPPPIDYLDPFEATA